MWIAELNLRLEEEWKINSEIRHDTGGRTDRNPKSEFERKGDQ